MRPFNNNKAAEFRVSIPSPPNSHANRRKSAPHWHGRRVTIDETVHFCHPDWTQKKRSTETVSPVLEVTNGHGLVIENKTAEFSRTPEVQKKVMSGGILNLSTNEHYQQRFASIIDESISYLGITRQIHTIFNGMRTITTILRVIGFFPGFMTPSRRHKRRRRFIVFGLFLYSIFMCLFNARLYLLNIEVSLLYKRKFGFLHGATVSHLISGLKPFINAVLFLIFTFKFRRQVRMLRMMDTIDLCFKSAFHASPNVRLYTFVFSVCLVTSFLVPFSWRIFEQIQNGPLRDVVSFVVVPVLTVWNVMPLVYYVLVNRACIFWCRVLRKALRKEHVKRHYSLKFYYEQFLRIADLQEAIGNVFNPFIMFSLAWSLLLLCLAIYFMTQPTSSLTEAITHEQQNNETIRRLLNHRILLNMGWSGIQILVAILYISVICATGMNTNESTRRILSAVLTIVPDASADLDRFQISCFVHKLSTQYMWGMTVWRAFPLERTTFFTLVSVIMTYSLLLLKLKESPAVAPMTPFLATASPPPYSAPPPPTVSS